MEVLNKYLNEEKINCVLYLSNQSIEHLDWKTIANTENQVNNGHFLQKYKSDEIIHKIISNYKL